MLSAYVYSYSTTGENWWALMPQSFSTFSMPMLRKLTAWQEDRRSMLHFFSGMSMLPQNLEGENVFFLRIDFVAHIWQNHHKSTFLCQPSSFFVF